jgi:hypothetical protein
MIAVWPDQTYQVLKKVPANKEVIFSKEMRQVNLTIQFFPGLKKNT